MNLMGCEHSIFLILSTIHIVYYPILIPQLSKLWILECQVNFKLMKTQHFQSVHFIVKDTTFLQN